MRQNGLRYLKAAGVGVLTLSGAGVAAAGIVRWLYYRPWLGEVVKLIPESQPVWRLAAGIILVILGLGVTGGVMGAAAGWGWQKITGYQSRTWWMKRGAIPYGLGSALVTIPLLLFMAYAANSLNGFSGREAEAVKLFVAFGLGYGLVVGLGLGWLTAGRRFGWILAAALLSYGLAGWILGVGLWQGLVEWARSRLGQGGVLWGMAGLGLAVQWPAGVILGVTYAWLFRQQRRERVTQKWVKWIGYGAVVASLIGLAVFCGKLIKFLEVKPGSLAGRLSLPGQATQTCPTEPKSRLFKVMLEARKEGNFWQAEPDWCGNRFMEMIYMPNSVPEFSAEPATANGGFDRVNELVKGAKREVLITTMEWQAETNPINPGRILARGVKELYDQVKTKPEDYPQGMTVRILLGNYPEYTKLSWGQQIWELLSNLQAEGLPALEDPAINFKVEVANYEGQYPHSHVKMAVVDGQKVMAAGFNYGYLHLPKDHPSGMGFNLDDLGLVMEGPVAREAVAVFDDLWTGANQYQCEPGRFDALGCQLIRASGGAAVLDRPIEMTGEAEAITLYRTEKFKEADKVLAAAIEAARGTIDMSEVNFTMPLVCSLGIFFPDICSFDQALPWMKALMTALEKGAKLRVVTEPSGMNGIENQIGWRIFKEEAQRRGLLGQMELKWVDGKMHNKAMILDQELVVVGSQNTHYSAWGEAGLAEFNLATTDETAVEAYRRYFEYLWDRGQPVGE